MIDSSGFKRYSSLGKNYPPSGKYSKATKIRISMLSIRYRGIGWGKKDKFGAQPLTKTLIVKRITIDEPKFSGGTLNSINK